MEIKFFNKVPAICKKYKYAFLILILGLVLILLPTTKTKKPGAEQQEEIKVIQTPLEERLANILCQVEGAGNVEVVLTISAGEETLFQENEDSTRGDNDTSVRKDTVLISDSDHNESGLVRQVLPAVYKGAIIVCQGANNPSVRLEIVNAVAKLTGLGANCISVLKMK